MYQCFSWFQSFKNNFRVQLQWLLSFQFRLKKCWNLSVCFFKAASFLAFVENICSNWYYTSSLVNANLFYANFSNTSSKGYHSSYNTDITMKFETVTRNLVNTIFSKNQKPCQSRSWVLRIFNIHGTVLRPLY